MIPLLGNRVFQPWCSRWEELTEALKWHARVATGLGAPTEFRLLNESCAYVDGVYRSGGKVFRYGFHDDEDPERFVR